MHAETIAPLPLIVALQRFPGGALPSSSFGDDGAPRDWPHLSIQMIKEKTRQLWAAKSRVFRYRYRYGYSISVGALATGIGAEPRIRALHLIWRAALLAGASVVRSVVTPEREQKRPHLMRLFEPIS